MPPTDPDWRAARGPEDTRETIEEIVGAAEVMRSLVTRVHVDQECSADQGTGGDGANLFNVLDRGNLVVAAAGARVASTAIAHQFHTPTSSSPWASPRICLPRHRFVYRAVDQWAFAPAHHGAMKHAVGPRKDLGMRTCSLSRSP